RLHVQRHRLFGAIEPDEVAGQAAHRCIVRAGEVANSRTLDFDDTRTEIGEVARRERRSDGLFQRDDGDSFQRLHKSAAILLKFAEVSYSNKNTDGDSMSHICRQLHSSPVLFWRVLYWPQSL